MLYSKNSVETFFPDEFNELKTVTEPVTITYFSVWGSTRPDDYPVSVSELIAELSLLPQDAVVQMDDTSILASVDQPATAQEILDRKTRDIKRLSEMVDKSKENYEKALAKLHAYNDND